MVFKKKIPVILILLIALLFVQSCSSSDITSCVKVNQLEDIDSNIVATILYWRFISDDVITYISNDSKITRSEIEFARTYDNKYPVQSEERLTNMLGLNGLLSEEYGQLIYYGCIEQFELFLYEAYDTYNWKICILYDDDVKDIEITHEIDRNIYSYQITEQAIYVYSHDIYKISLPDCKVEIIKLPYDEFDVSHASTNLGQVFISDNIYVKGTSDFESNENRSEEYAGVFLKYDFGTNTASTIFEVDMIEKVFQTENGYMALCNEKNTFRPLLKYYDKDFNLIRTELIDISSEKGNITAGYCGSYFSLYEDRLYGLMQVDGQHIYEIVVIDANTAKVLYQNEIINKKRTEGYYLYNAAFHIIKEGEYIDLSLY